MNFKDVPISYCANWPDLYRSVAKDIKDACFDEILRIEHIGSTALPVMMAKPIIDILVVVKLGHMKLLTPQMVRLGYISKGEYGISGRSYFSKPSEGSSIAVHVHSFEEGHEAIEKHIAFKKYLLSHADVAKKYCDLKGAILSGSSITREAYQSFKSYFLERTTNEALKWNFRRNKNDQTVPKVVIYALRKKNERVEILVFDQIKFLEVSPQLPSGTVELGESIENAARRELFEESGLASEKEFNYLGRYTFYKSYNDQFQERFIFALSDPSIQEE